MQATTQQPYKEAALSIALGICRDAVWHQNRCNWIGSGSEEHYGMPRGYARALGNSFYDGVAGIAWFLLHTQQVCPHRLVEKTMHGAMEQLVAEAEKPPASDDVLHSKLGFHTGWTGMAYVLFGAGALLQQTRYTKAALQLLDKIIALPAEHWGLDVIDGAAGAVPVLIRIYQLHPTDKLQKLILAIGKYLVDKADKQPSGWSWDTMQERSHNLTGLGHGAAGFAVAFAELYTFTGSSAYLDIARSVVQYEDSHFHAPQQNWPDFRNFNSGQPPSPEPVCSLAWCHGAPGIGLARLRLLEITKDAQLISGAETAVATTAKNLSLMMLGNYSMCHGVFGNAELLLFAAEILQQPALVAAVAAAVDECINSYLQKGIPIPNGLQSGHETPDFMLGSSGIGYFFLRLAAPEKVPPVLVIR